MASTFGVLAEFDSPRSLVSSVKKIRKEGFTKFDTYTPFPIHGMDAAMGLKESVLGWIVVCGGAFGLSLGFGLQTWASASAYKLIISGKPLFSYQAFVPVTFELMVLFSAFAAVFGMFFLNRLPQHYHPLFECPHFNTASSHGFFVAIEASDPAYDEKRVIVYLESLGATKVEVVEESNG